MWSALAGLLTTSLLLTSHGLTGRHCPKPVLPLDAQLSPAGVDVNLTCLEGTWEDNITVTWKLADRPLGLKHPNRVATGVNLLLKSVRHRDSGSYTCYRDGLKVRNIRLLVGETIETPQIFCSHKFPVAPIRCEWKLSYRPSPATKAYLVVLKGLNSRESRNESCHYYHSSHRFVCRLKLREGDHDIYVVSMCVTSITDSQVSKPEMLSGDSVLQPDPPVNVTVSAVERAPKKLNVTWEYPQSWNPTFYKLQFEVRYRSVHSTLYSTARVRMKTSYMIVDALMGMKHVVHVRAQEEFSHGTWSRWSLEAMGVPWIDPAQLDLELPRTPHPTDYYSTEDVVSDSAEDYNYRGPFYDHGPSLSSAHPDDRVSLSVQTAMNRTHADTPVDWGHLRIPQYTFVAGAILALGIILFIGIMFRYKKKWRLEFAKGEKVQYIFPFCPLRKLAQEDLKPPSNNIPLMSPPSSPISDGPTDDDEDPVLPATYDVTNQNYFFLSG